MKYYINDKQVKLGIFQYYLIRSIKCQTNYSLNNKEVHDVYINYFNDMKYNGVELSFKDKMSYKIRRY